MPEGFIWKRQGAAWLFPVSLSFYAVCIWRLPVSYTHLDVYKRQGYDYSFYDEDFRLMDGGVYENDEISIEEAAEELLEDEGWTGERILIS